MTLHVDLDLGFGFILSAYDLNGKPVTSLRVYGINAPELATPAGKTALAFAQTLLKPGDHVTVTSYGWDKFGGRADCSIVMPDGNDFGAAMIAAGQAVPYKP